MLMIKLLWDIYLDTAHLHRERLGFIRPNEHLNVARTLTVTFF